MSGARLLAVAVGLTPGVALGQFKPPPSGNAYFGAPADQKFDATELLKQLPAAKPEPKPDPKPTPKPTAAPPGSLGPVEAVITPPALPPPPPKIWTGGAEFGLNGSSGNADLLNIRAGTNFKRESGRNVLTGDLLYLLTNQQGKATKDQATLNLRDEQFIDGSPWSVFSAGQLEYDQFRAYDLRVGLYAGFGYQFWKTDRSALRGRVGAGAVREVGGDEGVSDRWVPEAVLGGEYTARLDDRQAFVTTVDFYPSLGGPPQYRVRARGAYEILLDPSKNLLLRLGVQDRYDSNPGPARRNDLDYFTSLLVKF